MLAQQPSVLLRPETLHMPGRTLDVREEEGHSPVGDSGMVPLSPTGTVRDGSIVAAKPTTTTKIGLHPLTPIYSSRFPRARAGTLAARCLSRAASVVRSLRSASDSALASAWRQSRVTPTSSDVWSSRAGCRCGVW